MCDLKKNWEVKKLGEVCDFQNGFAFKSNTYKERGLPIIRITNIQNQSIDTNELVFFDLMDYKENLDRFKVFKDDLVIAMSGATTGKIGINTSDNVFYLNQRIGKFLPKKELNKYFLYYYLSSKVEESLKIAIGAAQPNLSTEQINNFEIPIPPLSEQKRIVKIIETKLNAVERMKKYYFEQNMYFNLLKKTYLKKINNESTNYSIGDFCKLLTGGTPNSTNEKYYKNGNIPWLVSGDIHKVIINDCDKFITKEGMENSNARFLPKGSVLIALNGQGKTRGTVAILEMEGATCNQSLVSIMPDENIALGKYVYFNLLSRYEEIRKLTGDNERSGLSMEKIRRIKIKIPSLDEQKHLINFIENKIFFINKINIFYSEQSSYINLLSPSILRKAFNGDY